MNFLHVEIKCFSSNPGTIMFFVTLFLVAELAIDELLLL